MVTAPFEQWVWVEREPNGREGMIVAMIPDMPELGMCPMAHRLEMVARQVFGPVARTHAVKTHRQVRLIHMREVTEE